MFAVKLYRWYAPHPTVVVDPFPVEIDLDVALNSISVARVVFRDDSVWSIQHYDAVLEVLYYPAPSSPVRLFAGFVTERRVIEDTRWYVELIARSPEILLTRRVNAYPEDTTHRTRFNETGTTRRIDEIITTLIDFNLRSNALVANGRAGNAAMAYTITVDATIDGWYPRLDCAYQNVWSVIRDLVLKRKGRFWGELTLPVGTTPTVTFRYRSPSDPLPAASNTAPVSPRSYSADRVAIQYANAFKRVVALGSGAGNNRPAVAAYPTAYGAVDLDPEETVTLQTTDLAVLQAYAEEQTSNPPSFRGIVEIETPGGPTFVPGVTHPLGCMFTVVAGSVREPVQLIAYRVSQREKQSPRWQVQTRMV
ncbi:MAG: hypothetical protein KatS3mg109_0786 [Pirellulaceae bacterium]|nr:MAG: hypothetical protein KatS3mg109_0786 [Pirellulaceae bacterium]